MSTTPKGLRLHIGFFGRRNVGKSSLLNAITRQQVSIVSEVAGTTTDPVEKPMELLPLGPVLFIDTAGIDEEGTLGALRVEKTRQALERTEIAVLVAEPAVWGGFEEDLLSDFAARQTPTVVVFNKCDVTVPRDALVERLRAAKLRVVLASAVTGMGLTELREALLDLARPPLPATWSAPASWPCWWCPSTRRRPRAGLFFRRCRPSAICSTPTHCAWS